MSGTGSVSGNSDVGGLVGFSQGTISNSYSTGSVSCFASQCGGLTGVNFFGTISNSYATGSVSGSSFVGGLVGFSNGRIFDSYATGSVSCSASFCGGLMGTNVFGTISNSYATGSVSGSTSVGGLVGNNNTGTISNSYWDIDSTGRTNAGDGVSSGATGIRSTSSTVNAYTQATYGGFDFTNTWWMSEGNTRPLLQSEYSSTINNAHQLQLIGMNPTTLAASYTLGRNIDLAADLAAVSGQYPGLWNSLGFVPIGTPSSISNGSFNGTFDGLGRTINNLTINRPATDYVGLFGATDTTSIIRNVGLVGGSVTGSTTVGGLVGGHLRHDQQQLRHRQREWHRQCERQ